ncbi:hypothetical protein CIPAW_11G162800 [Carya illinoinensis]|uniref:Uncharacterized protein n=1 Tax=Carya illinoinensis TaxID=32201 RepID=A0A8T1P8S8_CARIL|nr:hypothetical protein CIPAW_11G162800 [Carya illinoinensis]KAG6637200.1 hypothetical protein CIPAW_11G162800 [Carya illinoinensis]
MDLKHKGITWVGNFFQKLEAVCQEVDDIVNKDVLPPLVDPVECQAQVVALKSNDAINTYLKAMMGDEENHVDVIKQSHVEPNADDHLKKQLPDTSNENPNVSAEENATEESLTEVLELFSLNDKEPFGASFSCEFSESNHQNTFGVVTEVPPASSFHCVEFQSPPKMGTVTDCREEDSQSMSDVSSMNTSSESAFSVISDEKTIVEMKLVCSGSSLAAESCSLPGKLPDNSLYAASCNNHGDFRNYKCNDGDDDTEAIVNCGNIAGHPWISDIGKRIQDAFASKKRLAEEYEQLAVWYGDVDMGSSKDSLQSMPATPLDLKNLPIQQACDSDWEFL